MQVKLRERLRYINVTFLLTSLRILINKFNKLSAIKVVFYDTYDIYIKHINTFMDTVPINFYVIVNL